MRIGGWTFSWTLFPMLLILGVIMWVVTRQLQSRRWAAWLFAIPLAIGLNIGIATAREPSGYVAAYGFGAAWISSVPFVVVGLAMIALRRLRRAGLVSLVSGAVILGSFYAVVLPAELLGLTKW